MLCYKDLTYCVSKCATKCDDKLTDAIMRQAANVGVNVCCADLKCDDYREKK